FPGGQGILHGALLADRTDPNVVFIAGDRQELDTSVNPPPPNANGCTTFCANVFRGVFAAGETSWQNIVCRGANGTAPHADARVMVFDANGDILQGNDGGIVRLTAPNSRGDLLWESVNGDIRPTEAHSAAYDAFSNVVFS